jgi:hypothetical protein
MCVYPTLSRRKGVKKMSSETIWIVVGVSFVLIVFVLLHIRKKRAEDAESELSVQSARDISHGPDRRSTVPSTSGGYGRSGSGSTYGQTIIEENPSYGSGAPVYAGVDDGDDDGPANVQNTYVADDSPNASTTYVDNSTVGNNISGDNDPPRRDPDNDNVGGSDYVQPASDASSRDSGPGDAGGSANYSSPAPDTSSPSSDFGGSSSPDYGSPSSTDSGSSGSDSGGGSGGSDSGGGSDS